MKNKIATTKHIGWICDIHNEWGSGCFACSMCFYTDLRIANLIIERPRSMSRGIA